MLDITFREDDSRIHNENEALAFNVMRKIALNLFKQDDTKSTSMAHKKKIAALDDEYRSTFLESGGLKCTSPAILTSGNGYHLH